MNTETFISLKSLAIILRTAMFNAKTPDFPPLKVVLEEDGDDQFDLSCKK
jgi:hypothetical protein